MKKGIACIGNLIVDIIKEIHAYPELGNLATINNISYTTGGLVPNCLLDLIKIDPLLHLEAVGLVGADEYGDYIINTLSEAGINTKHIGRHRKLGTSFTDVMSEKDGGERAFFQFRGANAALDAAHIDLESINADILHVGYVLLLDSLDEVDDEYGTVLAKILARAQKFGFKTSIDVVSEQGNRFKKLVPPNLKYTDYCIINEIEASMTTEIECRDKNGVLMLKNIEKICRAVKALGVRQWVVIHCPEGSFALDKNDDYLCLPSIAIPESDIAGKTGAGDAFCSGALYGAYKEMPLLEALKLATCAAAASLTCKGATDGMRSADELYGMIDKYGFNTL